MPASPRLTYDQSIAALKLGRTLTHFSRSGRVIFDDGQRPQEGVLARMKLRGAVRVSAETKAKAVYGYDERAGRGPQPATAHAAIDLPDDQVARVGEHYTLRVALQGNQRGDLPQVALTASVWASDELAVEDPWHQSATATPDTLADTAFSFSLSVVGSAPAARPATVTVDLFGNNRYLATLRFSFPCR
jgi:hypothetical protein